MFIKLAVVIFSLTSFNAYSDENLHSHGERSHSHPFPAYGLNHEHGNNIVGRRVLQQCDIQNELIKSENLVENAESILILNSRKLTQLKLKKTNTLEEKNEARAEYYKFNKVSSIIMRTVYLTKIKIDSCNLKSISDNTTIVKIEKLKNRMAYILEKYK